MSTPIKLRIPGLDRLAEEELRDLLQADDLEFTTKPRFDGDLPEPATITAVITLGSLSITALAVWLSKRRNRKYLKTSSRVLYPDGRVEEKVLELKDVAEDAVQPAIIAQLSSWLSS
jgi:hypothetical protein